MSGIRKVDRADSNLTEEVKVRLTEEDYKRLRTLAMVSNTYMASIARKAIVKYLNDLMTVEMENDNKNDWEKFELRKDTEYVATISVRNSERTEQIEVLFENCKSISESWFIMTLSKIHNSSPWRKDKDIVLYFAK